MEDEDRGHDHGQKAGEQVEPVAHALWECLRLPRATGTLIVSASDSKNGPILPIADSGPNRASPTASPLLLHLETDEAILARCTLGQP